MIAEKIEIEGHGAYTVTKDMSHRPHGNYYLDAAGRFAFVQLSDKQNAHYEGFHDGYDANGNSIRIKIIYNDN